MLCLALSVFFSSFFLFRRGSDHLRKFSIHSNVEWYMDRFYWHTNANKTYRSQHCERGAPWTNETKTQFEDNEKNDGPQAIDEEDLIHDTHTCTTTKQLK